MTGKLADTVMAVRNGEQLARKYQPIVFNPSTPAQVAQRAKLKLMSQLSAVLGPNIAMRRVGSVSARNLFTKLNIGKAAFADSEATIDITSIALTASAVGLNGVNGQFNANGNIDLSLSQGDASLSRVVYVVLSVQPDRSIRVGSSTVVSTAGADNTFAGVGEGNYTAESYVLAYGVRDNTEAARVVFGNLDAPTAEDVARIVTTRTLTESDITLTETRGAEVLPLSGREVESETKVAKKKS